MLNKYAALMRRAFGVTLEYRVQVLIWILSTTFPLIMLAVWLSLAEEGPIGGYDSADFVAYYLLALYVRQMTGAWVAWDVDYDIRHGDLSIKLLHPLHPFHEYLSYNLADKVLRLFLITPLIVIAAWLVPGVHFALTPLNLAVFVLGVAIAWYLRFMIQYVMALSSFWVSEALTLMDIQWMLFLLLGGTVAPLDLLPGWLGAIARYLPFRFMMSFPIEVLTGRLVGVELVGGLVVAIGWVALFQVASVIVWRLGIREFSAYGA